MLAVSKCVLQHLLKGVEHRSCHLGSTCLAQHVGLFLSSALSKPLPSILLPPLQLPGRTQGREKRALNLPSFEVFSLWPFLRNHVLGLSWLRTLVPWFVLGFLGVSQLTPVCLELRLTSFPLPLHPAVPPAPFSQPLGRRPRFTSPSVRKLRLWRLWVYQAAGTGHMDSPAWADHGVGGSPKRPLLIDGGGLAPH